MTARDRSAAAILATETSGDFDDVGAIITAMRHMLDGGAPLGDRDAAHLYVLAAMAETAWRKLDDAMRLEARR